MTKSTNYQLSLTNYEVQTMNFFRVSPIPDCPFESASNEASFVGLTLKHIFMKDSYAKNVDALITTSDLRSTMLSIGATIRKQRIAKGYKCAEFFAYEYQLNRSAYYGWEAGKNISMKKLIVVCEALDITLLEFFQNVKQPRRNKRNRPITLINGRVRDRSLRGLLPLHP